jgi:hypothetical protein
MGSLDMGFVARLGLALALMSCSRPAANIADAGKAGATAANRPKAGAAPT